jgi:DNA-binding MarR family transcriptional regulator
MTVLTADDCAAQRSPGRLIRRLAKLATAYVESRFEGVGLSFVQWVSLKVIRDGLVSNAGELAREVGITSGATTRLIDGLEARGLLARDRGAGDRRVVKLVVTDAGREAVEAQSESVVGAWNELIADLDQNEVQQLVAILPKMLATAERMTDAVLEPAE